MSPNTVETLGRVAGPVVGWLIEIIGRWIGGDDAPDVRRVIEILPGELRSDLEHARQRELMRQAAEAELGG